MCNPQVINSLSGKRALVTGASRGIGASTAVQLAENGAKVVINYRDKSTRAEKVAVRIRADGGTAYRIGADLTHYAEVSQMIDSIGSALGGLDILVMNASGGLETDRGVGYAMELNCSAQLNLLQTAIPIMSRGARVIYVTSHQAHFFRVAPVARGYETVARSKRAGEDALRKRVPKLNALGISFVVVSGDLVEGTITATLFERADPGSTEERRQTLGKLTSVDEFGTEVVSAVKDNIPDNLTRYIGDISEFDAAGDL